MRRTRQSGMAVLEVILVLALVATAVFVALRVRSARQSASPAPQTQSTTADSSQIDDNDDLTAADKELDKADLDAETADEAQLGIELSQF